MTDPESRRAHRPKARRLGWAAALAAGLHVLAFLVMGWRIPTSPPERETASLPPVEIQLLRRRPPAPNSSAPSPSAPARPSPAPPRPAEAPAPVAAIPAPQAPAPALAQGPPDCAPEDLPLLTDTEKTRCRNQIDVEKGRQMARAADEQAGRQVAEAARGPRTFRMPSEKEAYYDAVAQAYEQQNRGPPMAGKLPGIACSLSAMPFFGGAEVNRN